MVYNTHAQLANLDRKGSGLGIKHYSCSVTRKWQPHGFLRPYLFESIHWTAVAVLPDMVKGSYDWGNGEPGSGSESYALWADA